jgi:hypothetical protein
MPSRYPQFALWEAAIERRSAANEAERRRVLADLLAWLDAHAAEYGLDHVWIFGSVTVPGRFGTRSDVDLALVADPDLQQFRLAAALSQALVRDVDVILLDDCHFAAWILQEGLPWTRSESAA